MEQHIFHGSKLQIEKPAYGAGSPYNDYGPGFYCTQEADMAREWAVGWGQDGYLNHYRLEDDGLKILYLNGGEYTVLHWLAVLLKHRTFSVRSPLAAEGRRYLLEHFSVDVAAYDIVAGYRADDSHFSYAQDFLSGTISCQQLMQAMELGKLGIQYVIKSRTAFSRLVFEDAEHVLSESWYPKKESRDRLARRDYFHMGGQARRKGELYLVQMLDEELCADDLGKYWMGR